MNAKDSSPQFSLLDNDPAGSPPLPPLSDGRRQTTRRRGSRTLSFSSSTSSISESPSPSPSPFYRLIPSSSVPFSWERYPGIPKTPFPTAAGDADLCLPLPPPIRSAGDLYRKKRLDGSADPFASALAECAKDAPLAAGDDLDALWWKRAAARSAEIWRRATVADRLGVLGLYASCKTVSSVSDATIVVPRSALRPAGSYGLLNRRSE